MGNEDLYFGSLDYPTYGPNTVGVIQFFQAAGMNQQDELSQTSLLLLGEHQKKILNGRLSDKGEKILGKDKGGQIWSDSIVYFENIMKLIILYNPYMQVKRNTINKKIYPSDTWVYSVVLGLGTVTALDRNLERMLYLETIVVISWSKIKNNYCT